MVGHGGSSAGSYLADPTSPIPSHCASISTLRVKKLPFFCALSDLIRRSTAHKTIALSTVRDCQRNLPVGYSPVPVARQCPWLLLLHTACVLPHHLHLPPTNNIQITLFDDDSFQSRIYHVLNDITHPVDGVSPNQVDSHFYHLTFCR